MSITNKLNGLKEIWQFQNRWQLIVNRMLFPGEKINIYRYKGLEILVDHSAGDANGAREVLTSEMYRKYLSRMDITGPANVFDIGSNNGGFPLLLKSDGIAIKKLACVELNPSTFTRLTFNVERNFDAEFVAVNGAMCGEHRNIEIALGTGSAGDSIYKDSAGGGKTRQMQGYTFDELYETAFKNERVDICKMDIEGAELEVLNSPAHDSIRNCRYLLMEIHEKEQSGSRETVRAELTRLGFREIDGEQKNDAQDHVHFFINQN